MSDSLEKQDFQLALMHYGEEPTILPDELWALYQSALQYAEIRRQAAHKLSELMVQPVITVTPDQPLHEVAKLLLEKRVGGFPVVENGVLTGIITEGDLMSTVGIPARHISSGTSPLKKLRDLWSDADQIVHKQGDKVRDVMKRKVITAKTDDVLEHALTLMRQHQVTRLVIVDEQQHVKGILARSDILRFTAAAPQTTPPPQHGSAD
jgi:predicted transcriptional regulator